MAILGADERVRTRIAQILEDRGMNRSQFAKHMGKTPEWAYKLLAGGCRLGLDDLDRAAHVLGVPPAELLRDPVDELVELSPIERAVIYALRELGKDALDATARLLRADITTQKTKMPTVKLKPIFGKPRR